MFLIENRLGLIFKIFFDILIVGEFCFEELVFGFDGLQLGALWLFGLYELGLFCKDLAPIFILFLDKIYIELFIDLFQLFDLSLQPCPLPCSLEHAYSLLF